MFIVPPGGGTELRDFATAELEKIAEALRKTGLTVETRLGQGPPGPVLIELAERVHADLIVIGTRGLTGFEHLLFGSTAEHVVRRSRCPVLTIHPKDGEPREPVETVIVPTDLSADAAQAVEVFTQVFDGVGRPHVVLAFADPTPPYLDPFKHENLEKWHQPDLLKQEIDEQMNPLVTKLRDHGFEVEAVVLDGGPVPAIVDLARERSADMIVMSTHGRSAIVNLLLGRTAQRIVQHAPCPVLTARPTGRPAPPADTAD
jgi:nucleotide-binding universal stress UspA family protein